MKFGYTINNNLMMNSNGKLLGVEVNDPDPYNPLGLPPNTFRVRTNDGLAPNGKVHNYAEYDTATLVEGTTDIYDVYKSGNDFGRLLRDSTNLIEVLGANTNGVTSIDSMFLYCSALSSIPLFDTSNVTSFGETFMGCKSLTSVPAYDTSKVKYMGNTFSNCVNVQTGALNLYRQVSTQTNPPSYHYYTFTNCGINTETGSAELAQIPSDWK